MSICVGLNLAYQHSITAVSWPGFSKRTHGSCSELECVAYKVLDDSKVTKRSRDGCFCKDISAPYEELARLVRRKSIPLVQVHWRTDGSLSVNIMEHQTGQDFVAVYHVFSHGLGNGISNSLPSCQIERVVDLVAGLSKEQPPLFWLDAFCVPGEPFALRRFAIN